MKVIVTREKMISLIILLPYIENRFFQKYFQIYFKETYIRSISIVLIMFILFFLVLTACRKKNTKLSGYRIILYGFVMYTFFQIFFSGNKLNSFCVWTWVSVPILFALSVGLYCEQRTLDYKIIIKYMIRWFCLYTAIVVLYYIPVYHLFIDSTVRLNPRGGGAVIFGYTIALVFAFCVQYRDLFKKKEYYMLLCILSIGALGTASRASVWPIVFLWIINFMFTKVTVRKIIIAVALIPFFLFLSMLDFGVVIDIADLGSLQRLFSFTSTSRFLTQTNILILFSEFSFLTKIFGTGLNAFFPYQKWVMYNNDIKLNMFTQNGFSILVQPHNSFLYGLMESGILGIVFLLGMIIYVGWSFWHYRNKNFIFKMIFLGVFFFLNCFDSIFYVQPGVAGIFWLLLIIAINENRKEFYSSFGSGIK